jgi:FAD-dependent urate hydroxylase
LIIQMRGRNDLEADLRDMAGYEDLARPLPIADVPSSRPLRVLVIGAGVSGISVARGLLRDGHDVTVFDQRTDTRAGGGAVTIWSNGETVLRQLGVDMDGAGQLLSSVQVMTSRGHRIATLDVAAMVKRLGAPVRMVPRGVLLDRLLTGFPTQRIRCGSRATRVASTSNGVQVEFEGGSVVEGDLLIGADGLHSMVRDVVGAHTAEPTGWCSWQGLVTVPELPDKQVALIVIGEHGNTGVWPAGGSAVQWWFDLPWSHGFVRPDRPIEVIRSNFSGWSNSVDLVLAKLTNEDLVGSPYPHFRHPIPQPLDAGGHVARRCRAHHAAHARAGHQPGFARHDGVVQGAFGLPHRDERQQRRPFEGAALVREHQAPPSERRVPSGVASGRPR